MTDFTLKEVLWRCSIGLDGLSHGSSVVGSWGSLQVRDIARLRRRDDHVGLLLHHGGVLVVNLLGWLLRVDDSWRWRDILGALDVAVWSLVVALVILSQVAVAGILEVLRLNEGDVHEQAEYDNPNRDVFFEGPQDLLVEGDVGSDPEGGLDDDDSVDVVASEEIAALFLVQLDAVDRDVEVLRSDQARQDHADQVHPDD